MKNIIIKSPAVHIHYPEDSRLGQVLDELASLKTMIQAQGERQMADGEKLAELKVLVADVNQNTNDIAAQGTRINAKFDALLAELEAKKGGLTAEEVVELKTELTALRGASQTVEDNLKAVGADPAEPLPVPDPIDLDPAPPVDGQ